MVGTRNIPGDIAKTFSVTTFIDKLAAKVWPAKAPRSSIGFQYICELMLEQNILIGGEESGRLSAQDGMSERDATRSPHCFSPSDGLAWQINSATCSPLCTAALWCIITYGNQRDLK